jgi:hypothetical protein
MDDFIIITISDLPGYEITKVCGEVFGLIVRGAVLFLVLSTPAPNQYSAVRLLALLVYCYKAAIMQFDTSNRH